MQLNNVVFNIIKNQQMRCYVQEFIWEQSFGSYPLAEEWSDNWLI